MIKLNRREQKELERKKKEFDESLRDFDEFVVKVKKVIRLNSRQMINFIMFYKPKGKFDKGWHIFEMIIIYIFIQCAWRGITGW